MSGFSYKKVGVSTGQGTRKAIRVRMLLCCQLVFLVLLVPAIYAIQRPASRRLEPALYEALTEHVPRGEILPYLEEHAAVPEQSERKNRKNNLFRNCFELN